jgi:hypothetical protein
MKMIIVPFFMVPAGAQFRARRKFWERVEQNTGVSVFGERVYFDTAEQVGIPKNFLKKNDGKVIDTL